MSQLFKKGIPGKKIDTVHFEHTAVPSFAAPFYAGYLHHIQFPRLEPHVHTGVELFSVLSGSCMLYLDGTYFSLKPGDCNFIDSSVPHAIYNISKNFCAAFVHVSTSLLVTLPPPSRTPQLMKLFFITLEQGATRVLTDQMAIGELLLDAAKLYSTPSEEGMLAAWAKVVCSIADVFLFVNPYLTRKDEVESRNERKIANAIAYIHQNYTLPITIETLAEHCNLSIPHFFTLFNQFMHCTPHDYIIKIRINHALQLLATSDKKIQEIAFDCGFESQRAFNHVFRSTFHTPPRSFRKS